MPTVHFAPYSAAISCFFLSTGLIAMRDCKAHACQFS
jgi:hypothetical protein